MKNKSVIYVLCALLSITLVLGVVGLANKNNGNGESDTPTPVNNNYIPIEFKGEEKAIESLESKLDAFDFTKANKEFKSSGIRAYIENNLVKVDVQKSAIPLAGDNTPDVVTYTIDDIKNPVGVQAHISKLEGNRINVYTIDESGSLYLSTFNADPNYYNDRLDTYEFKIDFVTSFVSLMVPIDDAKEVYFNYVVFKTNDGSYYTDYQFGEEEEEYKIIKLINK